MNTIKSTQVSLLGILLGMGLIVPAFAEAPVYDVDAMPSQYQYDNNIPDTQVDSADAYPPAPPSSPSMSVNQGAYVPEQPSQPSSPRFEARGYDSSSKESVSEAGNDGENPSAASVPTHAGSTTLTQRLQKVEQQLSNLQEGDSSQRVESLQSQVQSLRNQVEQLTHQLQQAQEQQKSMYADLDKRVSTPTQSETQTTDSLADNSVETTSSLSTPAASTTKSRSTRKDTILKQASKKTPGKTIVAKEAKEVKVATTTSSVTEATTSNKSASKKALESQPNVAEEQQIYQTAYTLIKAKKYNEAVNALKGMLVKYPTGQFASNAHYWLGELYGLMSKNDEALNEFNAVVKNYPNSPRISDAQLKVGLLYAAQFKWAEAKAALKSVVNHYPGTASARLALEQIKQIKQAGH